MKTYKGLIKKLESNQIFVFGSNTQGRHAAGAALWAKKNAGAKLGYGRGLYRKSYALVTTDLTKIVRPSVRPIDIIFNIVQLYMTAKNYPDLDFMIAYTAGTKNLSGYTSGELAAMFHLASVEYTLPDNIVFEESFSELIVQNLK